MAAAEALTITRGIDDKVKVVDHKVGSVIQGELYFRSLAPRIGPQPFTPLGVMETGVAIQQVFDQVTDLNRL